MLGGHDHDGGQPLAPDIAIAFEYIIIDVDPRYIIWSWCWLLPPAAAAPSVPLAEQRFGGKQDISTCTRGSQCFVHRCVGGTRGRYSC
jgi:hypothetical protein